jgi:hypothetical protein
MLWLASVAVLVTCGQLFWRDLDHNSTNHVVIAFAFIKTTSKPKTKSTSLLSSVGMPPCGDHLSIRHRDGCDGKVKLMIPTRRMFLRAHNTNSDGIDEEESASDSDTPAAVSLSNEEIGRYSRHLVLSNVGMVGQLALKQSTVLVIGAGGLGSPVLLYLAAAGVGHIGIVDGDTVDVSNLQRQIIHNVHTVHTSKCQSAQQAIVQLNPNVKVRIYEEEFTVITATRIVADGFAPNLPWNIVIDGSDNFPTKYLIKYVFPFGVFVRLAHILLGSSFTHIYNIYFYSTYLCRYQVTSVLYMVYHGYILLY